jgi:predicted metal-binding protein
MLVEFTGHKFAASPLSCFGPCSHRCANAFTGEIAWVRIDLEDDDVSHMEDPEQVYHRIMARQ